MRLADLRPRWLDLNGQHVAIMFLCPHCAGKSPEVWLTCFFVAPGDIPKLPNDYPIEGLQGSRGERALFYEVFKEMGHADPAEAAYHDIVSCRPSCAWERTSDDFTTMTCTPSIDASKAGHWHGHVTSGEIVGGVILP